MPADQITAYYRGCNETAAPKLCRSCDAPIYLAVITPEGQPSRVNLYCPACQLEHVTDADGNLQRVVPLLGAPRS